MKTEIFSGQQNHLQASLKRCKEILDSGGLIAFPTETVYGLGGNGLSTESSKKIYAAKGRPSDNPLILHIGRKEDLIPLVKNISEKAGKLIDRFWPGPLTLVFEKSDLVPLETTGGLSTVAVRMPADPIANALLRTVDYPVAAPSANLSGRPSTTKVEHVVEDLSGRIEGILSGDDSEIGLESTIVDMTSEIPTLLRPGFITREDLEEVIGELQVDPAITEKSIMEKRTVLVPKAPGMKYRHYAPKAEMFLVSGDSEMEMVKRISERAATGVGILTVDEHRECYEKGVLVSLGSRENPTLLTKHLFDALRQFDHLPVTRIYAEDLRLYGVSDATMNRLLKAAGGNVI